MERLYYTLLLLQLCNFPVLDAFNIETSAAARRGFVKGNDESSDDTVTSNREPFFGYTFRGNAIQRDGRDILLVAVSAPLQTTGDYTSTSTASEGGERVPLGLRASGSRALKQTESLGVLYACDMLLDDFATDNATTNGILYNCSNQEKVDRRLQGADISQHDSLGISLISDSRKSQPVTADLPTDRLLTCAHLRAFNCSYNYKAEGTCYLSEVVSGRGDGRRSVNWHQRTPCREECTQSKIDLVFVVDGSESITPSKFETVKDWIINVVSGFDISGPVQVGVVQYSHYFYNMEPEDQIYLTTEIEMGANSNHIDFTAAVRKIKYHGYTTYTAHAIEKVVRDDFNGPKSRYPKARRVMILLTDGNSTDKEKLPEAVSYLTQQDVTSFAVGVRGYVLGELLLIAGSEDRVITVQNFNQLQGIVEKIQFGIQLLEGSSNPNTTNGLMQCQAGISSDMSECVF